MTNMTDMTLKPLKRITIKGFKSIRELDLTLSPLNILIGANGAGKSNLISAFTFLHQMAEGRLAEYVATRGGADTIIHFGRKGTESLSFGLDLADIAYTVELLPTVQDALVIKTEECRGDVADWQVHDAPADDKSSAPSAQYNNNESIKSPRDTEDWFRRARAHLNHDKDSILCTHDESRRPEFALAETLRQWSVFHFNDTSDSARLRVASNINDNDHLRPDGSNIAAMLYLIQQKYAWHYRNIVEVIQLVAPFFDDFQLKPDAMNDSMIRLSWRHRKSEQYFDAHALSDGTLRFICLATLLMQPNLPLLILLDEPELGLHPYAISVIAGMIRSVSKSVQIILSTQSTSLVDCFQPEDIIVVDRKDRESVFRHISKEELGDWLDDYSIAELWEKNVLGGRPA